MSCWRAGRRTNDRPIRRPVDRPYRRPFLDREIAVPRTMPRAPGAATVTKEPAMRVPADDLEGCVPKAAADEPSPMSRLRSLASDLLAGLTNAVVSVPSGMATAALTGVNPVYGLYATEVSPTVGGLFASSQLMQIATTGASALTAGQAIAAYPADERGPALFLLRSEERRVGKECSSRWWRECYTENEGRVSTGGSVKNREEKG